MTLAEADRRLVRLFVAIVLGRWDDLRALRRSAAAGEPDRRWRETVLQAHLFAGFPRVVEALGVLAEEGGLGEPERDELRDPAELRRRGRALFERIYADDAGRVQGLLESGHPDFAEWIEEHAYGRVLARPGLGAATRELLASAGLAATGQDRQLASHARGALRCGATPTQLLETLEAVRAWIPPDSWERARRVALRFASG